MTPTRKSVPGAGDVLLEALKAISYHYDNQDMSHVDFRVMAKQRADDAIRAASSHDLRQEGRE